MDFNQLLFDGVTLHLLEVIARVIMESKSVVEKPCL